MIGFRREGWRDPVGPSCLLFLLAFGVRAAGLGWGLPDHYHGDEDYLLERALYLPKSAFDPHLYAWPAHPLFYLVFLLLGADYAVLRLAGNVSIPEDFALRVFLDASGEMMIGRAFTAAVAGLAAAALYAFVRRFASKGAAALTAALYALHPLSVENGSVLRPDSLLDFFLVLAALASFRASQTGAARDFLWAGAFLGGAFATRFAGLVGVVLLASIALIPGGVKPRARQVLTAAGGFLLGVAVTGPYLLLRPATTAEALWTLVGGQWSGYEFDPQYARVSGWSFFFLNMARHGGPAFPALLLAAAAWAAARRDRALLSLALPVAAYYAGAIGPAGHNVQRYLLPILPYLCALIGAGAWSAAAVLLRDRRAFRWGAMAALAAALLGPPAWRSAGLLRDKYRPDSRREARAWILDNVPAGTRIMVDFYYLAPQVETRGHVLARRYLRSDQPTGTDLAFHAGKREAAGFLRRLPPARYEMTYLIWNEYVTDFVEFARSTGQEYFVWSAEVRDSLERASFAEWPKARSLKALYRLAEVIGRPVARFGPQGGRAVGPAVAIYKLDWTKERGK